MVFHYVVLKVIFLCGVINHPGNDWCSQVLDNFDLTPKPLPRLIRASITEYLQGVLGAFYQFTKGGRPSKRGRPQELDRDLRVLAVFRFLRRHGWTRQGAFDYIADLTDYSPDNIRSIVIKLEKRLPSREKNQPNFSP